jgi:hypothetical protein
VPNSEQKDFPGNIECKNPVKYTDHKFYGLRNLRSILNGIAFRGGANNVYNYIFGPRENENPLPEIALKNLCIQGFSKAVYLYSKNFEGPYRVSCKTEDNQSNTLEYIRLRPEKAFNEEEPDLNDLEALIKMTYEKITTNASHAKPIYLHCYNGWHASGRAAALLLEQFCDADPSVAISYWIANARQSYSDAYRVIWRQLLIFDKLKNTAPFNKYKIDAVTKSRICPDFSNYSKLAQKDTKIQEFFEDESNENWTFLKFINSIFNF